MARWDSIKARRCRSQAYNDDKAARLVKERSGLGKRLPKQVVLRWWPPSKKAAAEEGEEGVDGDEKALLTTTATVPFMLIQVKLADFYITSTKAAAAKEDAHREKVKAARKGKKKSKDPAASSKVVAEARWLDKSERQDRMASSTKREKSSLLCQGARAGQEVQGANANKSYLPPQASKVIEWYGASLHGAIYTY
jgi:hypothetical protein